jgi:hypothetical protein
MCRMLRSRLPYLPAAAALLLVPGLAPTADASSNDELVQRVIQELNQRASVAASDVSYPIIFDAYIEMDDPPFPIGEGFNLTTIWPGMDGWDRVSGWAESNDGMAKAILDARNKTVVGLPYGRNEVGQKYREAGILVDIGVGASLRDNNYPYLAAVDTIAAYATAEVYRRLEAGDVDEALELTVAHLFVIRQFCDREFLVEKKNFVKLLSLCLQNTRDVFLMYQDRISVQQFADIATWEIPFLRPDRNRLLMPEADRVVSEALIDEVFDPVSGAPDAERFAQLFAGIQASKEPLTRFGAARRWSMISTVHSSLDASKHRLALVYDDWWRRWRVQAYDPILEVESQFDRTNPVRYAAVIYSMQDIGDLFEIRNQLIAEVNGTAIAAGLCAYHRNFDSYPSGIRLISQFARRLSNVDPYDTNFGLFQYRLIESSGRIRSGAAVNTPYGQMRLQPGQALLWSVRRDHKNDRATDHTDDGLTGDIVMWPPVRAWGRKNGFE